VSARLAATRVLLDLERRPTALATAVEREREPLADPRDRGLLLELASGTLRWRGEIDWLLQKASARKLEELAPAVRAVLRIAAYQVRHLDRVPTRAIVHDAVAHTRALGAPRAAGFVNAVLRQLIRRRDAPPPRPGHRDSPDADLAYLSITLSHPEWLVSRWLDRYGFDATEAWCRFNNETPELTAWSMTAESGDQLAARLTAAGVSARAASFVRRAVRLAPGALGRLPDELRHQLFVQDEGSQIVAETVGVEPGERVLDVCASPGGKTLVLARTLGGSGLLVAADLRRARVATLASAVKRAGVPVAVVALDAARPLPFGRQFDRVLLDVPCSGLGTIRRDPDVKWSRKPGDLSRFAVSQQRLIAEAAEAVRPGGRLVYATCSSEPEENEAVVAGFLAADGRFSGVRADPSAAVRDAATLVSADGWLVTRPFRDGLDAFFAAVLVRRSAA